MAKNVKIDKKSPNYDPQFLLDAEDSESAVDVTRKLARIQADVGGSTAYRSNIMYRGQDLDKYGALQNMVLSAKEAIRFSQVVYYRFGMVRNALDTMAEFTVKDIKFHSSKATSRDVLEGWANGVDLKSFLDQVALEYYRSGNVYIYRFESPLKKAPFNISNSELRPKSNTKIPVKYTILDPNTVDAGGRGIVGYPSYRIIIPKSEVQQTLQHFNQDPRALGDLPPEFQSAIKNYMSGGKKKNGDLVIELNPDNLIILYRKKQPYETYATPFLAGVFEDLEFRQELRNMDKAVSRVVSRILIHVKVGNDKFIPSPNALTALQNKLSNPSTSTYLITDGSVEIEQYFPDIGAMLDPKKYEPVTLDIATALGVSPAVYGNASSNFSNNALGIKVLVERIVDGQSKILNQFLIPESMRVAKAFNLKNPSEITPEIVGVNMDSSIEMKKLYSRLYEVGLLGPKSTIEAFKEDTLPSYEEEVERQQESVGLKDTGLFQPILNRGGDSNYSGRPEGTPNPTQSAPVNSSPKGSKASFVKAFTTEQFLSAKKVATKYIKSKLKLKTLNQEQAQLIDDTCAEFLLCNQYSEEGIQDFIKQVINI